MMFYVIMALFNAITSSILGLVVYFRNRHLFINKIFGLFCLSVALWSYGYFAWMFAKSEVAELFIDRIFLMGPVIFISILFFHFIVAFVDKIKENKKILTAGYIIFFLFFISDYFTPYFIKGVEPKLNFKFWPEPGFLYHPFLIIWFFYIFASVYLIIKEIRSLSKKEEKEGELNIKKVQLKYILTGTLIGFIGGGSVNYFLWYDIPTPPFTNFLVSVGLFIIAYSVLKHHLFNIRIMASELFIFIIWIFIIVKIALSNSYEELMLNIGFALLVFIITLLLVRSIYKEIELDRKLLEESQKSLDFEQRLRKTFSEIAEERAKRIEDAYHRGTDSTTRITIYDLEQRIKELEKELKKKQKWN